MKSYYVYILAGQRNGTLYIGITNNLQRRIEEHQASMVGGFTKKYNVKSLVYYEQTESVEAVITREKQLKKWNRAWKIGLIEKDNPEWLDISKELFLLDSRSSRE